LIMPSLGVRPDQHEMIDLPRRATKPNRNMHGAGQVCRHQTVGGPAGSRDLSADRLVTKVGGRVARTPITSSALPARSIGGGAQSVERSACEG
jgi:hypothetical protein